MSISQSKRLNQIDTLIRDNETLLNANNAIDEAKRMNIDIIEIVPDLNACGICQSKAGVYSLSGKNNSCPPIKTTDMPPYHPNCQCKIKPVFKTQSYLPVQGASNRSPYCSNERLILCSHKLYKESDSFTKKGNEELKSGNRVKALVFYLKAIKSLEWITKCTLQQNNYCTNLYWAKYFLEELIKKINKLTNH